MRINIIFLCIIMLLAVISCTAPSSTVRSAVSKPAEFASNPQPIPVEYSADTTWQPSDVIINNQNAEVRYISADQEIKVGQQDLSLNEPHYNQLASYDQYLNLNGFGVKPAFAVYRIGPFKADAQPSKLDINFSGNKDIPSAQWKLNYAVYNPLKTIWQWYSTRKSYSHIFYYGREWLYNYQGKNYLYVLFAVDKNPLSSISVSSMNLTAITYAAPKQASWNILLYFAGDNNLAEYAVQNLNQAEQVGSTDNVNILAQYDINYPTVLNTDKVWRIRMAKDLNSKALKIDGDSRNIYFNKSGFDSSSPKNLYDFLIWAKTNFPAERNCLVLWDHGGGWLPGHTQNRVTTSILGDDTEGPSGGELADNTTIAEAITKSGLKLDVLYFDACNMGQLESLYDFKSNASYIVGSQILVPGPGGEYFQWLSPLISLPSMTPLELAKQAVDAYNNQYTNKYNVTCTLSVYDTAQIDNLTSSVLNMGLLLKAYKDSEKSRLGTAILNSYTDDPEQSNGTRDLIEFVSYMKSTDNTALKTVLTDIEKYHNQTVLYHKRPGLAKTNGIALFLPDQFDMSSNSGSYKNIAFNKTTNWLDALQSVGVPAPNNTYEFSYKVYDNWKIKIYWDAAIDLDLWCYEPSLNWHAPATTTSTDYCNYSPDALGDPSKEEWVVIKPNQNNDKYYIDIDYPAEQAGSEQSQFWAQIIDNESQVIHTIGPRTINKGENYNLFELLKQ